MTPALARHGWLHTWQEDGGAILWRPEIGGGGEEVLTVEPDLVALVRHRPKVKGYPLPRSWRRGVSERVDARDYGDLGPLPVSERDRHDQEVRNRLSPELHRRGLEKVWRRVDACGEVLGLKVCTSCGTKTVHASRCNVWRLCPTCARVRSRELSGWLEELRREVPARQGHRWRLLTLTLRTGTDYRAALRLGVESFSWLWTNYLKGPDAGCVRTFEFGPLNGTCHVHVLYWGRYVPQRHLSDLWCWLTGGSRVVDVRQVGKRGDYAGAVAEVAKYCTKIAAVPPDRLVDFYLAMQGTRMLQTYGCLYGRRLEPDLEDLVEPCACGCRVFLYVYGCEPRGPPSPA